MKKKFIMAILGLAIIMLSLYIFSSLNSIDDDVLEQTFVIQAVYFENDGYAEISFHDKSAKTKHVILEILGMPESYHKEYKSSTFTEKIQFLSAPKYGWQSVPVTLLIEHEEFGKIGIKTEIRPIGEMPSKVIFSRNLG